MQPNPLKFLTPIKRANNQVKVKTPEKISTPGPVEKLQLSQPSADTGVTSPVADPETPAEPTKAAKPQVLNFDAVGEQTVTNANGTISVLEAPSAENRDPAFTDKYGPWGVVTGASQGIGAEYARTLAEKGMNVVMVARNADKLSGLAKQLNQDHGVKVRVVAADLGNSQGVEQVKEGTKDLEVGLLVNNAGSWQVGQFLDNDIDKEVGSIGLNLEAPLKLSHHFAEAMSSRGQGGILNVGSLAGAHGVPGQAAYSGKKAFLNNFTEALHHELKGKGVDVMITNPGPVVGETSQAHYDQSKLPMQKVTAREVVSQSLGRLGKGESSTIPGWLNRTAMNAAVRLMPRDYLTSIAGFLMSRAAIPSESSQAPAAVSESATVRAKTGDFKQDYGPWGVVTGASQGLGAVYAENLAKKGMNVVVVARSEDKLKKLATKLQDEYGVQVKTVAADMSKPEGLKTIEAKTGDLDVGLLVNNAGAWQLGEFLGNDVDKDAKLLDLNIAAPLKMCHTFGHRFKERGGGGIINVGSGVAPNGVPGQATYSAGKGYMLNFSESLNKELGEFGVDVLVTLPAGIRGEASSHYDQSKVPMRLLEPEDVVEHSFQNLGKTSSVVPNTFNKLAMTASKVLFSRHRSSQIAGEIVKRATIEPPN